MLHKEKLYDLLRKKEADIFRSHDVVIDITARSWRQFFEHADVIRTYQECCARGGVPVVIGHDIAGVYDGGAQYDRYGVVGIDGSQMYPDRHRSVLRDYYLLNSGGCYIRYQDQSEVDFFGTPFIERVGKNELSDGDMTSVVDTFRELYEFDQARQYVETLIERGAYQGHEMLMMLFDGSLFLWNLEQKSAAFRDRVVARHQALLNFFYEHKILTAGYISASWSKELVNLVRMMGETLKDVVHQLPVWCRQVLDVPYALTDAQILMNIVPDGYRTAVFLSGMKSNGWYTSDAKICFFYLRVRDEIVRIEIPHWLACSDHLVSSVASLCLDQARKGNGYPVVLAEAHEQAVIKSSDRDFFEHLVMEMGMQQSCRMVNSEKSIKKRGMPV